MPRTLPIHRMILVFALTALSAGAWSDDRLQSYDRVSLTATASTEVDNDTLVAVMYYQREGIRANELAGEVNERIRWAVERAERVTEVKVSTLDYRTNPVYRDGKMTGWRVRQSIRLESRDTTALSTLIGDLQQKLAVQNITYSVSPEKREKAENATIAEAIRAFSSRASQITRQLDRGNYRLVHMEVNTGDLPVGPVPQLTRTMALAAAPPPVIEPGTQSVRVTVNGTIELEP